jgi:hypothetical protein
MYTDWSHSKRSETLLRREILRRLAARVENAGVHDDSTDILALVTTLLTTIEEDVFVRYPLPVSFDGNLFRNELREAEYDTNDRRLVQRCKLLSMRR